MNRKSLTDLFASHERQSAQTRLQNVQACIVTDFQFLYKNPQFVFEFVLALPASFRFVLPWVCWRDLESVNQPCQAQTVITKLLELGNSCLVRQSESELFNPAIASRSYDEAVLDCCFFLQSGVASGVILLAADTVVCERAMACQMPCLAQWQQSAQSLVDLLLEKLRVVISPVSADSSYAKSATVSNNANVSGYSLSSQDSSRVAASSVGNGQGRGGHRRASADSPGAQVLLQISASVLGLLLSHLPNTIITYFRKAYGDDMGLIVELVARSPPWTLVDMLFLLRKHWVAVFSEHYHVRKNDRPTMEDRLKRVEHIAQKFSYEGPGNELQVNSMVGAPTVTTYCPSPSDVINLLKDAHEFIKGFPIAGADKAKLTQFLDQQRSLIPNAT